MKIKGKGGEILKIIGWLIVVYFIGVVIWMMWYIREFWIISTFTLAIILWSFWDKIKTDD